MATGAELAACAAAVNALVIGLLATEVPADRRSATLNLVYLPLYAAGIVGPATGGLVVALGGIAAPFVVGALVFFAGSALIWATSRARAEPAYSGS